MDTPRSTSLNSFSVAVLLLLTSISVQSLEPIQPISPPTDLDIEKVMLGKQLFSDTRLSKNLNISCESCHLLERAGADGLAQSVGTHGELTSRNTPSVFNASLNVVQFWDGRANTLEEQVDAVIKNPVEMDASWDVIVERLQDDEQFSEAMRQIYKPSVSQESITDALAEYMKSLVTVDAPFDLYLAGDESAISSEAKAGYEKFKSHGCVSCHQGKNVGGNLFQRAGLMTAAAEHWGVDGAFNADLGRYEVTKRERDKHIFRVPSLRNVTLTSPYFHSGSVSELRDAIKIMSIYQLGKPISDSDVELIFSFLGSLNGSLPTYSLAENLE